MEEWRAIPGFEGYYEVSDLGRVRSLDRVISRSNSVPQTIAGRIMRQQPTTRRRNYLAVKLSTGNVKTTARVAVLVSRAFIGERPAGEELRHLNGRSMDNRAVKPGIRHPFGEHPRLRSARHALGKQPP